MFPFRFFWNTILDLEDETEMLRVSSNRSLKDP